MKMINRQHKCHSEQKKSTEVSGYVIPFNYQINNSIPAAAKSMFR